MSRWLSNAKTFRQDPDLPADNAPAGGGGYAPVLNGLFDIDMVALVHGECMVFDGHIAHRL